MNLLLRRTKYSTDGIFSELSTQDGELIAVTLERSYEGFPKLQPGVYTCRRGQHQLHSMTEPFTTFEITGVPGHTNMLFHAGNKQEDSDGCVLVGTAKVGNLITDSRAAHARFMALQDGVDEFQLTVI